MAVASSTLFEADKKVFTTYSKIGESKNISKIPQIAYFLYLFIRSHISLGYGVPDQGGDKGFLHVWTLI